MAVTPITITEVPFQGTASLTAAFEAATAEMSFINDGYTILFIRNNTGLLPEFTIGSSRDNATRLDPGYPIPVLDAETYVFSPMRPIWWNTAGVVNLSFNTAISIANIQVAALKYTF